MACKGCGPEGNKMTVDPNGERYNVIFMIRGRGKRMVTGRATREKLGYIERGSPVENVHEADIAADAGHWACFTCGQQFTVQGEQSWCNTCTPRAGGRRDLSQLRPRPASDRIKAQTQHGKQHPNFAGMQDNPWGTQKDVSPRQQPNHAEPAQQLPPPPGQVNQLETLPPPPPAGQKKFSIPQVEEARKVKEQAMGLPVAANEMPPPPIPLAEPPPAIDLSRGVTQTGIETVVGPQYVRALSKNGVHTLYDAGKLGHEGLTNIKGIGDKIAERIITASLAERA